MLIPWLRPCSEPQGWKVLINVCSLVTVVQMEDADIANVVTHHRPDHSLVSQSSITQAPVFRFFHETSGASWRDYTLVTE